MFQIVLLIRAKLRLVALRSPLRKVCSRQADSGLAGAEKYVKRHLAVVITVTFSCRQVGNVQLATLDLSQQDYDTYYLGYANGVLWPVFHYRLDLANFDVQFAAGYRRVNRLFAHKLLPLLRPDDVIWIHDYHLIPLAAELRAMGCGNRIGYFPACSDAAALDHGGDTGTRVADAFAVCL